MNTIENVKSFADHKSVNPSFFSKTGSTKTNSELVASLNITLAHAIDLRSHTKQALWNAKGPNSYSVQKMLKEFSKQIDSISDELSKRILTFGGTPNWTADIVAKTSLLTKLKYDPDSGAQPLESLLTSYEMVAQSLTSIMKQAVKSDDYGTASLVTDFAKMLDDQCQSIVANLPIEWVENTKRATAS